MKIQITNLLGVPFICPLCPTIPAASRITVDATDKDYAGLQHFDTKNIIKLKVLEFDVVKEAEVVVVKEAAKVKVVKIDFSDKTAADLKALVMKGTATAKEVLAFEVANKNRTALVQWLKQFED